MECLSHIYSYQDSNNKNGGKPFFLSKQRTNGGGYIALKYQPAIFFKMHLSQYCCLFSMRITDHILDHLKAA